MPLSIDQDILFRLQRGYFDEDGHEPSELRVGVRACVAAKRPIFPNRKLGLEYAYAGGMNALRGIPVASVAVANLRDGEGFSMNGRRYEVASIGKIVVFDVTDAGGHRSVFRTKPDAANWSQFARDVDGLLMASFHGVDAGDLLPAWRRDPWARG